MNSVFYSELATLRLTKGMLFPWFDNDTHALPFWPRQGILLPKFRCRYPSQLCCFIMILSRRNILPADYSVSYLYGLLVARVVNDRHVASRSGATLGKIARGMSNAWDIREPSSAQERWTYE